MILKGSNRLVLSVDAPSTSLSWSVVYVDIDPATRSLIASDTVFGVVSVTETIILGAPAGGIERQVKSYTVVNSSDDAIDVSVVLTPSDAVHGAPVAHKGVRKTAPLNWTYDAGLSAAEVKGDDGRAATVSIGSVATGAAGSPAQVTNIGDAHDVILHFDIPAGVSPAVTVQETQTLPPGAAASVENVGTEQTVQLVFKVPAGPDGQPGADGQDGDPGSALTRRGAYSALTAYHALDAVIGEDGKDYYLPAGHADVTGTAPPASPWLLDPAASKLDRSGGTLSGPLVLAADPEQSQWMDVVITADGVVTLSFNVATGQALFDPTEPTRLRIVADRLPTTGGTLTGAVVLAADAEQAKADIVTVLGDLSILWADPVTGRLGFDPDPQTVALIRSYLAATPTEQLTLQQLVLSSADPFGEDTVYPLAVDVETGQFVIIGVDRKGRVEIQLTPSAIAQLRADLQLSSAPATETSDQVEEMYDVFSDRWSYSEVRVNGAHQLEVFRTVTGWTLFATDARYQWQWARMDQGSILAGCIDTADGAIKVKRIGSDGLVWPDGDVVTMIIATGQSLMEFQCGAPSVVRETFGFSGRLQMLDSEAHNIWLGKISSGGASLEVLPADITGLTDLRSAIGDHNHGGGSIEFLAWEIAKAAAASCNGWSPPLLVTNIAEGGQSIAHMLSGAGAGYYFQQNFATVVQAAHDLVTAQGKRLVVFACVNDQGQSDANDPTTGAKHETMRSQLQAIAQGITDQTEPLYLFDWGISSHHNPDWQAAASIVAEYRAAQAAVPKRPFVYINSDWSYPFNPADLLHKTPEGYSLRGQAEADAHIAVLTDQSYTPLYMTSWSVTGSNQITVHMSMPARFLPGGELLYAPQGVHGIDVDGGTVTTVAFSGGGDMIITVAGAASAVTAIGAGRLGHGASRLTTTMPATDIGSVETFGTRYDGKPKRRYLGTQVLTLSDKV